MQRRLARRLLHDVSEEANDLEQAAKGMNPAHSGIASTRVLDAFPSLFWSDPHGLLELAQGDYGDLSYDVLPNYRPARFSMGSTHNPVDRPYVVSTSPTAQRRFGVESCEFRDKN